MKNCLGCRVKGQVTIAVHIAIICSSKVCIAIESMHVICQSPDAKALKKFVHN